MPTGAAQPLDRYDLHLKEDESAFIYQDKLVNLSPKPFQLLKVLFEHRGKLVLYRKLVKKLYKHELLPGDRCGDIPQIHTIQQHKRKICLAIGTEWIAVEEGKGIGLLTKRQLLENSRVYDQASKYLEREDSYDLKQRTTKNPDAGPRSPFAHEDAGRAVADELPSVRPVRRRNTNFENPRSLDFEAFIFRLKPPFGPKGYVTISFPTNGPQPMDDFDMRLYHALEEADWPLNEYNGESHIGASGYGITLGAILDEEGRFPAHLQTLRYAFERSGMPVQTCTLSSDREDEGVSIIVGADPP